MSCRIIVSQALRIIELGGRISNYSINFDGEKIEPSDVMKLSKAGVIVPKEAICYDDEALEYDEEFEGEWIETDTDSDAK
jgi:hypothetical protein